MHLKKEKINFNHYVSVIPDIILYAEKRNTQARELNFILTMILPKTRIYSLKEAPNACSHFLKLQSQLGNDSILKTCTPID